MKESAWGYLIITLGVIIMAILFFVQRLTTTNEEEYYLNREIVHSAMIDAVDYSALHGDDPKLIMMRDKFVEIFTRRFAESVTLDKSYKLDFYQIIEEPPSATVRIRSYAGATNIGTANNSELNVAVDNIITAVLIMDDDGEVQARPPEKEEFVAKSGIYWAITFKGNKEYYETNPGCIQNCDKAPNVTLRKRAYNFFEFYRKPGGLTGTIYLRSMNYFKAKYASDINQKSLINTDYVRYSGSNSQYVFSPVFLLHGGGHDVITPSDELEYLVLNFSISDTPSGPIRTYEVIFKPDPNGSDEWLPVDEYRTDKESQP